MMRHEFNLLRRILKERSGIELSEDKADLVEAKLRPFLREFGFPSIAHLTLELMKPNADRLRSRVAQRMAVGETYFYRDETPFTYFATSMLPRLMKRRQAKRRIRIWCAAAAAGQEPYSLAMLLADVGKQLDGWKVDIVATDFAEDALLKARSGLYSQFEVQRGLPVSKLVRYFQKSGKGWQIKPDIRSKVIFREHNLLDDYQELGEFDIILCRNVLIYFDEQLRKSVLARLAGQLADDGYLVLGSTETVSGTSSDFTPVPENLHGIFCLSPVVPARRAEKLFGHRVSKLDPFMDGKTRAVELDRETADLLEAHAKARGLTVTELLAEMAAAEPPAPEKLRARPFKRTA